MPIHLRNGRGFRKPELTLGMTSTPIFLRPEAKTWSWESNQNWAPKFHTSIPGFQQSVLISLPKLATELGIKGLYIKNESSRLELPAFKILGASWAIARAYGQRLGLLESELTLSMIKAKADSSGISLLVAATDGNHGRAVARMGKYLDCKVEIFLPFGVTAQAIAAIQSEGAVIHETNASYDEAVAQARDFAGVVEGAVLIQDTSWLGYEEIPNWIVEGYQTLCTEIDEQIGTVSIDVVVIPVGVGSLAHAVVAHYRGASRFRPALLSVEPTAAACLLESLHADERTSVDTSPTIMAGLNCGTPSEAAWPLLRNGISAAVAIDDEACAASVKELIALGIDSGPCGGATLAGLRALLSNQSVVKELGITNESNVILINTEGFAANPLPKEYS